MGGRGSGASINRNLDPGQYTFSDLGRETGVSVSTLKSWHRDGLINHVDTRRFGTLRVYVFDDETVQRVLALKRGGHRAADVA
jgi:DNA-binding transcriptional MerR regulator